MTLATFDQSLAVGNLRTRKVHYRPDGSIKSMTESLLMVEIPTPNLKLTFSKAKETVQRHFDKAAESALWTGCQFAINYLLARQSRQEREENGYSY